MSYAPIPMVPGPVALHDDVIAALGQDYGSGQVESDFLALYDATSRNLGKLMGTTNDVALMTGEGMLALWGALKSCLWFAWEPACLVTAWVKWRNPSAAR